MIAKIHHMRHFTPRSHLNTSTQPSHIDVSYIPASPISLPNLNPPKIPQPPKPAPPEPLVVQPLARPRRGPSPIGLREGLGCRWLWPLGGHQTDTVRPLGGARTRRVRAREPEPNGLCMVWWRSGLSRGGVGGGLQPG